MASLTELALFAGAGGGLLAGQWLKGWRTICYVERDPYAVKVIRARIRDGLLHDAPIWDDVKTFDGRPWRGCVDIVSAGFPCQPFSVAGRRLAADDDRNGWSDTIRIIDECRPRFAFLENVPGLLARSHGYFGTILRDLAACGYDARWCVLSAAEVGAPHKRDRIWILATDADRTGCEEQRRAVASQAQYSAAERTGENVVDVARNGTAWWETEPDVGRVVDGLAYRVDRLRTLGNGQVPLVAAVAWELLTGDY